RASPLVAPGVLAPAPHPHALPYDHAHTLVRRAAGPGWTGSVKPTTPTQLVGLSWSGNREGQVDVRVKRNGAWGDWDRVDGDPAEGPDDHSRENHHRTGAGPLWVGHGVQDVQVRGAQGTV